MCQFGVNLSVRKQEDKCPMFSFGLNEFIFHQYIFTTGKAWKGPKGELAAIPKDKGYGIMISAFQSCEFGFTMKFTLKELHIVNQYQ